MSVNFNLIYVWFLSIISFCVWMALAIWITKRFASFNHALSVIDSNPRVKYMIVLSIFMFLLIAYLAQPSFYFPTNNGHLGDNYYHTRWVLDNPTYLKPHHILFPMLGGQLVVFYEKIGLLDPNSLDYYEQAYLVSGLVIRLSVCFALILFSYLIYRITRSPLDTLLSFLIVATSYAFWAWGVQNSAIGLGIAVSLIGMVLGGIWYKKRNPYLLFMLGILASLGVLVHISQFYFALGIFFSVLLIIFTEKTTGLKKKIFSVLPFFISSAIGAATFYFIESQLWNEVDPFKLFKKLAEVEYLGAFGVSRGFIGSAIHTIIVGLHQIVNYDLRNIYPIWESVEQEVINGPLEYLLYSISLGSLFTLISLVFINYRSLNLQPLKGLIMFSAVTSIVYFIGFFFRDAGSYSAAATPAHLVLLISLLLSIRKKEFRAPRILVSFVLVISGILYNTISEASIFRTKSIESHPYYQESKIIVGLLKEGEIGTYFRDIDLTYYPNASLVYYYSDTFENIEWKKTDDIERFLNSAIDMKKLNLFFGPEVDIENLKSKGFDLKINEIIGNVKKVTYRKE